MVTLLVTCLIQASPYSSKPNQFSWVSGTRIRDFIFTPVGLDRTIWAVQVKGGEVLQVKEEMCSIVHI